MYLIIRSLILIFFVLLFLSCFKLFKMKKQKIFAFIFCLVLCSVIVISPFENLFYSFSSPEKLFNYISTDEIVDVAYGDESCMIYYETSNNVYSFTFSKKQEGKYKILNNFSYKKVYSMLDTYGSLDVYNVSGTNDFYVTAVINPMSNIEVYGADNLKIDTEIKRVKNTDFIFFSLTDLTDNHYFLIDSKKVKLKVNQGTVL